MKIDINKAVFDIVKDNDKVGEDLVSIGFCGLNNPIILKTLGKKMSIKRGAKMMGIGDVEKKLEDLGYEIYDSSLDPEIIKRQKLIESYIKRLSQGEDLEKVRLNFKKNFENVSSSEIMDAEEKLLESGMDKAEVMRLCNVHSSLFHGMTETENIDTDYEKGSFLDYFQKENEIIKNIIKNEKERLEKGEEISDDIYKISEHYRKKGDLIYPILKSKYNKPGPSDVMWAVDIEIFNNIKKSYQTWAKRAFDRESRQGKGDDLQGGKYPLSPCF